MNIKNKVLDIANKYKNTENIKNPNDIDLVDDLGYDSLSFIQFINDLENQINIEIDLLEIDLTIIRKLNVLVEYIEKKVK